MIIGVVFFWPLVAWSKHVVVYYLTKVGVLSSNMAGEINRDAHITVFAVLLAYIAGVSKCASE